MIKKRYDLIENGICHDSFPKCREGLDQAYQRAEQIISDDSDRELWQLEIHCTSYDDSDRIVSTELVDDWEFEEGYSDMDESMDGDFDSAMTSAGFGMDEDYGLYE